MAELLTERQQRLLTSVLVLGAVALGFIVMGFVAQLLIYFNDTILVFFLAWLTAFILSPIVGLMVRHVPRLPRLAAVVLVYTSLVGVLVLLTLIIADAVARSTTDFIKNAPELRADLPTLLGPWQARLNAIGLSQIDLAEQVGIFLDNLSQGASELVGPIQELAVASLGVFGNFVLVLVFSIYMVIDRDRITTFLFRIVPPSYGSEARLLETSVSRSFGGFLRGQAVQGIVYAGIAALTSTVLGLDYLPVTTAATGVLQMIPFFGPFLSWAPPVLVAIFQKPEAIIPAMIMMGIGWFFVMNILQPRIMADAVGIHPIIVLGSVLIGAKLYGIAGAIFGVPIAAVVSAFFFFYLNRLQQQPKSVAARAALRVGRREGRPVRVPREPGARDDIPPGSSPSVSPTVPPGGSPGVVPGGPPASSPGVLPSAALPIDPPESSAELRTTPG